LAGTFGKRIFCRKILTCSEKDNTEDYRISTISGGIRKSDASVQLFCISMGFYPVPYVFTFYMQKIIFR
jgi:hypothetical protein